MDHLKTIVIPADVPCNAQQDFLKNYRTITRSSGKITILACDHRIEHLNKDFFGAHIAPDALHPEHIFKIAQNGTIGALAVNLGLISRYGRMYPNIPYIAKLSGKTDLMTTLHNDPMSKQLWNVSDILTLKKESGINICGVGVTLFLGGEFEANMLEQAAQTIFHAHEHGLVCVLWVYLRGKAITDEQDPELTAGACGLAAALGADVIKIKPPRATAKKTSEQWLHIATQAAGNTQVVIAGGEQTDPQEFLTTLYAQIHEGGAAGNATGRNIFQKTFGQAIAFTNAIAAIVHDNKTVKDALKLLNK